MSKKKENKSFIPEDDVPLEATTPSAKPAYEVCLGIGVPPRSRKAGGSKYPLESLKVGDGLRGDERTIRNVSASSRAVSKRTGFKFSVRRDPDHPGLFLIVRSE